MSIRTYFPIAYTNCSHQLILLGIWFHSEQLIHNYLDKQSFYLSNVLILELFKFTKVP